MLQPSHTGWAVDGGDVGSDAVLRSFLLLRFPVLAGGSAALLGLFRCGAQRARRRARSQQARCRVSLRRRLSEASRPLGGALQQQRQASPPWLWARWSQEGLWPRRQKPAGPRRRPGGWGELPVFSGRSLRSWASAAPAERRVTFTGNARYAD